MAEVDHAWAAGFFDGEGSALVRRNYSRLPGRVYKGLVLCLVQVDRRVLERFVAIVGRGPIRGPYPKRHQAGRDYYQWSVSTPDDVAHVLGVIEPYLGPAKREQLEAAKKEMEGYAARPQLKRGPKPKSKHG